MGKPRKSQKSSAPAPAPPAPVPAPMATRNVRQRTYTTKQMENVMTQMTKEDATEKKKFIAALRAEQELEEHMGFAPNPILHHTQGKFLFFSELGELSDEGDNEYEEEDTFFSCVTIPPPIKTVICNGRTLVHCVPAQDSNDKVVRTHVLESQPPRPRGALVHHVPVTYPVPVRMEHDRPLSQVSDKENHELVGTPAPESGPPPPHQRGAQVARTPAPAESGPPRPQALVRRVPGTPCPAPVMMEHEHLHDKIQTPQVQSYHDHDISFHPYDQHHEDIDTEDHWMEYEEPSSNFDCSSLPTSLGVRKSPPSRLDSDTTVVTKSAHTGSTRSRGRVRVADFDVLSKGLLEDAIGMYHADITTWNPFPNRVEDRDLAFSKFTKACLERNLSMEFEEDHLKLITSRAPQTRGHIKTIARALVESLYGLSVEKGKRANWNKVEDLLERFSFVHKDPIEHTGIYRHPIVQAVINKAWFQSKTDDGVVYPEYSDGGIPLVTIAIVLTVVECCLDEWATGERQDVPFSATVYQPKFVQHLNRLKDFEVKTKDAKIMPRLREHLLSNARKHAKVSPKPLAAGAGVLEDADVEAAKREWADLVLSDTDQ